ncbi:hypothetical protein [Erythrobacter sanguineus]|uniref:Porin n=1 Tax=Erythrobacter sanguineus TaxID=198312 RepID=A0A1M7SU29_9SPHN|nr:hypothetical protein [Erythrobacter sanguineus]SHN61989.1 hypothetical protein SAMN02745193_02354 [Erythrobacter sanguineus]
MNIDFLARNALLAGVACAAFATPAAAQDAALLQRLEALERKFEALEDENRTLKEELVDLRETAAAEPAPTAQASSHQTAAADAASAGSGRAFRDTIGISPTYAFRVLDQAVDVNSKPLVQLEALQNGELSGRATLSGQVTAIANFQWSNRDSKFGYLMRNPTSANQIGDVVSEALLHSANLAVTARVTNDLTAYAELLYDPQQNFAAGTITGLARNNISLRRGWLMWGNLDKSPVYALVGKMDVPFGLNDTVNPFTNSTNWHAFSPLAYGAQLGFHQGGLDVRAMAVQGGAQFRSANAPVEGTNVPSRLNNFAVDARYTIPFGDIGDGLMVGGSYQHATSYCQGYPVFHFNPCQDNNPGIAAYGRLDLGPIQMIGEYAQTTKAWPGSNVPIPTNPLNIFPAVKAKAFTVGGRYSFGSEMAVQQERAFAISGEFSKFIAGAEDSPWERQNQAVAGFSWFPATNFNLFAEFIHVDGFAPLNFLSGGNFPDGSTWSDRDATTNVILIGGTAAF